MRHNAKKIVLKKYNTSINTQKLYKNFVEKVQKSK